MPPYLWIINKPYLTSSFLKLEQFKNCKTAEVPSAIVLPEDISHIIRLFAGSMKLLIGVGASCSSALDDFFTVFLDDTVSGAGWGLEELLELEPTSTPSRSSSAAPHSSISSSTGPLSKLSAPHLRCFFPCLQYVWLNTVEKLVCCMFKNVQNTSIYLPYDMFLNRQIIKTNSF